MGTLSPDHWSRRPFPFRASGRCLGTFFVSVQHLIWQSIRGVISPSAAAAACFLNWYSLIRAGTAVQVRTASFAHIGRSTMNAIATAKGKWLHIRTGTSSLNEPTSRHPPRRCCYRAMRIRSDQVLVAIHCPPEGLSYVRGMAVQTSADICAADF